MFVDWRNICKKIYLYALNIALKHFDEFTSATKAKIGCIFSITTVLKYFLIKDTKQNKTKQTTSVIHKFFKFQVIT